MEYYSGTYGNHTAEVLYQGEGKSCWLRVVLRIPELEIEIIRSDELVVNPLVLSAWLESDIGYSNACEFLYDNNVDPKSQLWFLNHNYYPGPRKV